MATASVLKTDERNPLGFDPLFLRRELRGVVGSRLNVNSLNASVVELVDTLALEASAPRA